METARGFKSLFRSKLGHGKVESLRQSDAGVRNATSGGVLGAVQVLLLSCDDRGKQVCGERLCGGKAIERMGSGEKPKNSPLAPGLFWTCR
jgi:hypothetical protein